MTIQNEIIWTFCILCNFSVLLVWEFCTIYFDLLHFSSVPARSPPPSILPCLCAIFLLFKKKICQVYFTWSYTLACVALYWSVVDLPQTIPLRKIQCPRIYQLPRAPQLVVGLHTHLLSPWWDFCLVWVWADIVLLIHKYICPPVSRNNFLATIQHLWFLESSHSLSRNDPWHLLGGGVIEMFHLRLRIL